MARTKDPSAATTKAWLSRKRNMAVREREAALAGPIAYVKYLGGGVSKTYKVTLEDGSEYNFKLSERNDKGKPEHEVGAWEVAKLVGMDDMVPPAIIRVIGNPYPTTEAGLGERDWADAWDPPPGLPPGAVRIKLGGKMHRGVDGGVPGDPSKMRGSFAEWQEGTDAQTARAMGTFGDGRSVAPFGDSEHDVRRAAMFDFIIGNCDRHSGNWVVDADDKIKLIDHNRAFYNGPANSSFVRKLVREKSAVGPSAYAKPYLEKKSHILDALARIGLSAARVEGVSKRIDWAVSASGWGGLDGMYPEWP